MPRPLAEVVNLTRPRKRENPGRVWSLRRAGNCASGVGFFVSAVPKSGIDADHLADKGEPNCGGRNVVRQRSVRPPGRPRPHRSRVGLDTAHRAPEP